MVASDDLRSSFQRASWRASIWRKNSARWRVWYSWRRRALTASGRIFS